MNLQHDVPQQMNIELPGELEPLRPILAEHLDPGPVVYFLVRRKRIIYVGKSESIGSRIRTHHKRFVFDRVFYLRVPNKADLHNVEATFILALTPRNNKNLNAAPYQMEAVLERFGAGHLKFDPVKRAIERAKRSK